MGASGGGRPAVDHPSARPGARARRWGSREPSALATGLGQTSKAAVAPPGRGVTAGGSDVAVHPTKASR